MLTGCAVSISKYEVLFIGGHHTVDFYKANNHFIPMADSDHYYPIAIPVNNQVIKYDFKSNKWEHVTDIPIVKVSKAIIRLSSKKNYRSTSSMCCSFMFLHLP